MVGGSSDVRTPEQLGEFTEERRRELASAIRGKGSWNAEVGDPVRKENHGNIVCRGIRNGDSNWPTSETIYRGQNVCIAA